MDVETYINILLILLFSFHFITTGHYGWFLLRERGRIHPVTYDHNGSFYCTSNGSRRIYCYMRNCNRRRFFGMIWFLLYSYHRYLPNLRKKDTRASGLWGGYIFLREGGISRVWCRLERQTYWRLLHLASPEIPIILTNAGIALSLAEGFNYQPFCTCCLCWGQCWGVSTVRLTVSVKSIGTNPAYVAVWILLFFLLWSLC